jgi:SH3-like domain-containing protein
MPRAQRRYAAPLRRKVCMTRSLRATASVLAFALLAAAVAGAEEAWVRGASLNLRAGAGIDQPVLGNVAPGERLEVLASSGEWVRVRRADGSGGWIAASYLLREAPPAARIAELEAETQRLREELDAAGAHAADLRQRSDEDARAGATLEAELERTRRESDALRAGARWPEWIAGALIFSTGMALGAWLRGVSGRRRQTRLRL